MLLLQKKLRPGGGINFRIQCFYAKCTTAYKALIDIAIHKTTPCNNGLNPTDTRTILESPAPIRNKVNVNPALAITITHGLTNATAGIYVLAIKARINKPIK